MDCGLAVGGPIRGPLPTTFTPARTKNEARKKLVNKIIKSLLTAYRAETTKAESRLSVL